MAKLARAPELFTFDDAADAPAALPLVDARDSCVAFCVRGSLRLAPSELSDRSLELPPKSAPYNLLASSPASAAAVERVAGPARAARLGPAADAFVARLRADALVAGDALAYADAGRLWHPSPLAAALLPRLSRWLAGGGGAATPRLTILDAGAGTGRNAVFLAEGLGPRAAVVGVDNRRAMVEKLVKHGARAGLPAARLAARLADVRALRADGEHRARYHVAAFFRATVKDAIAAAPELLLAWPAAPPQGDEGAGGRALVVIEAFHESAAHPARESTLAEGEAAALLAPAAAREGWRVERHDEARGRAEDGRPLLNVVVELARAGAGEVELKRAGGGGGGGELERALL